ncbi:MAG: hypothetical protein AABZ74_10090 [Cyanobacteriota bacterium]
MSEEQSSFYMDYIQETLNLRFNKSIIRAVFKEKGLDENSEEINNFLSDLKISKSSIKRWLREGYDAVNDKKFSFNSPRDEKQLLKLAGFLDIDPLFLVSFDQDSFSKIFKSLEGNILIGNILKWGKIHRNFMFLYKLFMPLKHFPSEELLDLWNTLKIEKKTWVVKEFFSTLEQGDKEREKVLWIKPNGETKRQLMHLAFKKPKPLAEFEFWQEYKFVIIQPITDFYETMKEEIEKDLYANLISIINVNGSFSHNIVKKGEPFLIKTRFQEPKTAFRISSFHNFDFKESISNFENIKKVFDNPC